MGVFSRYCVTRFRLAITGIGLFFFAESAEHRLEDASCPAGQCDRPLDSVVTRGGSLLQTTAGLRTSLQPSTEDSATEDSSLDSAVDHDYNEEVSLGQEPDWNTRKSLTSRLLVVPKHKLLFCYIEKNACTTFNRFINELNGLTEDTRPADWYSSFGAWGPWFLSSASTHFNWTREEAAAALRDPSWKKAVFLRDPAERLLSAYGSKCAVHEDGSPIEDGGNHCMRHQREAAESNPPSFAAFVEDLMNYSDEASPTWDPHFAPQDSFCMGLEPTSFDYVGLIGPNLNVQVRELLALIDVKGDEAAALADKYFAPDGHTEPWRSHKLTSSSSPSVFHQSYDEALLSKVHKIYASDYAIMQRYGIGQVYGPPKLEHGNPVSLVWVHAFGRSGSTTLYNLLREEPI